MNVGRFYENTLVLCLEGCFYEAYGDSGYALSFLTGYKLKRKYKDVRCGFPATNDSVIKKVQDLMIDAGISYIFLRNDEVVTFYDSPDNRFREAVALGKRVCQVFLDTEKQQGEKPTEGCLHIVSVRSCDGYGEKLYKQ